MQPLTNSQGKIVQETVRAVSITVADADADTDAA